MDFATPTSSVKVLLQMIQNASSNSGSVPGIKEIQKNLKCYIYVIKTSVMETRTFPSSVSATGIGNFSSSFLSDVNSAKRELEEEVAM